MFVAHTQLHTPHSVGTPWTNEISVADFATYTTQRDWSPCPQQDSNPQSQQSSGFRPATYTPWAPGSAHGMFIEAKNVSIGSLENAESYVVWPVKICVHLKALTDNLQGVGSPEIVPRLSISWFVYSSNGNWRIWRYIDHHCCFIFRMPRAVFSNQG